MDIDIKSPFKFYNKAIELMNNNNLSDAQDMLSKCLALCDEDVEVLNLSGMCAYFTCDFEMANIYWTKSLAINIENNKAVEYLKNIHSDNFNDFLLAYNIVIDKASKGEYLDASLKLEALIKTNPPLVEPHIIIGLCYLGLNNKSKAMEAFSSAHSLDKGNKKNINYLANLKSKDVKASRSVRVMRIVSFGAAICLVITIGAYYGPKVGKTKISEEKPTSYIQVDAKTIKVEDEQNIFNTAALDFKANNYDAAVKNFEIINKSAVTPNLVAESIYLVARCYEMKNEYNKSTISYEQYIGKHKGGNYYDESLYYCGILYYKLGDKSKAKDLLIRLTSEIPQSMYNNDKVKYIINN